MKQAVTLIVKGTYYYGAGKLHEQGRLRVGSVVRLIHEPDNPHDRNAVAIYDVGSEEKLGHVGRELAAKYAALADAKKITDARVSDITKDSSGRLRVYVTFSYMGLASQQIIPEARSQSQSFQRQCGQKSRSFTGAYVASKPDAVRNTGCLAVFVYFGLGLLFILI